MSGKVQEDVRAGPTGFDRKEIQPIVPEDAEGAADRYVGHAGLNAGDLRECSLGPSENSVDAGGWEFGAVLSHRTYYQHRVPLQLSELGAVSWVGDIEEGEAWDGGVAAILNCGFANAAVQCGVADGTVAPTLVVF
jgi:hypothetical protein